MDYQILKQKKPSRLARDVTAFSIPIIQAELQAIEQSRLQHEQTFLLFSAELPEEMHRSTLLLPVTSVDEFKDSIAGILPELDLSLLRTDKPDEMFYLGEPGLDAHVFYDEKTDAAYAQLYVDSGGYSAEDLRALKKAVMVQASKHGFHGFIENRSFVSVDGFLVPLSEDLPSFSYEVMSAYDEPPMGKYMEMTMCHLYQGGSCIAQVSFDRHGESIISYPAGGIQFDDIEHARSYTFGISNQINQEVAQAFGINGGEPCAMSSVLDEIIFRPENRELIAQLWDTIASQHELSVGQAKDAFWDLVGGNIYGSDLHQFDEVCNLYVNLAQEIGRKFPQAQPVINLWMARFEHQRQGLSPSTLQLPRVVNNQNSMATDAAKEMSQQHSFKPK